MMQTYNPRTKTVEAEEFTGSVPEGRLFVNVKDDREFVWFSDKHAPEYFDTIRLSDMIIKGSRGGYSVLNRAEFDERYA